LNKYLEDIKNQLVSCQIVISSLGVSFKINENQSFTFFMNESDYEEIFSIATTYVTLEKIPQQVIERLQEIKRKSSITVGQLSVGEFTTTFQEIQLPSVFHSFLKSSPHKIKAFSELLELSTFADRTVVEYLLNNPEKYLVTEDGYVIGHGPVNLSDDAKKPILRWLVSEDNQFGFKLERVGNSTLRTFQVSPFDIVCINDNYFKAVEIFIDV
jgi:hypothetical protein